MGRIRNRGPLEQAAGRAVRDYLESLRTPARRRTAAPARERSLRRLAEIQDELVDAPPVRELKLIQERHELRRVLASTERAGATSLEDGFVEVAGPYSRRHRISYATWRDIGVPASVLRRAGLAPMSDAGRRAHDDGRAR